MPRIANSKIMTSEELRLHKQKLRRKKYENKKAKIALMPPEDQQKIREHQNEVERKYWRRKYDTGPRQPAKTPEERSAYKVQWAREKRQRVRIELFNRYGGKCVCCGISDYRWFTLHHKNHDGGVERNHTRLNAANRLYHLIKQPKRDDLELLCYNCHLAEDFFGGCPHKDPTSAYFISREAT